MAATTVTEMSVTYLIEVLCNFSDRDSGSYKSGLFCSQGNIFRPPKKAQLVFVLFLQFAARVAQNFVEGRDAAILSYFSDSLALWNKCIVKALLHI